MKRSLHAWILLAALLVPAAGRADDMRAAVVTLDDRSAAPIAVLGPLELPEQLAGTWHVRLCANRSHAWIRLESPETGEVHTLGRYRQGCGGERRPGSTDWLVPSAAMSGVQWDLDLKLEPQAAECRLPLPVLTVVDPVIFRGACDGLGHGGIRNNCATYARDAWAFYGGEKLPLPPIHTPAGLRQAASR